LCLYDYGKHRAWVVDMDFTDNVLECLYQEDCFIEYMSVNSGRTLEGWFTLAGDKKIKQYDVSDTIVVWDIENEKWEDIRTNTICRWQRRYNG